MDAISDTTTGELSFAFGPYRLVPARQLLLFGDHPVKLGGRAFELLRLLVQRSGQLVTKDELIAAAWPGTFVHESNLKVNMWNLRRALGDTKLNPRYVATIAGRGYMFVAGVETAIADFAHVDPIATDPAAARTLPLRHIVGREMEIAEVLDALRRERHLTLVGAGGIGKTTIAIAAARAYADHCPDGVRFVDLAAIDDIRLLPVAMVTALGIKGNPGNGFGAILDYLRPRQMLVVLDNCEHVLPAATIFASRLAADSGKSKLLATSREPLDGEAEYLIRVGALAAPDPGQGLDAAAATGFPAVELFARRAAEWAGYEIADDDWDAVASICRSVEGLPLAIELAAAQLESDRPADLLAMLDRHLGFPRRRQDGSPPRHETMLATIDWSYRLLPPKEAALFRAISVFADTFELEDAIDVAAAIGVDAVDVMTGLGGLVAKSLLTAKVHGPALRYRLLDSMRRYAADKRREDPADAALRRQHAARVLALFRRSEEEWNWLDTGDWIARYVSRFADLRAALGWAYGEDGDVRTGIELTVAALMLWSETSILSEAQGRAEQALALAETVPCDDLLKAKLACSRGWSLFYARKMTGEAEAVWYDAIAFARNAGNLEYEQRGLVGLAFYLLQIGKIDDAIAYLEEANALSERHHDWTSAPEGERALAWAKAHRGEFSGSGQVLDRLAAQYTLPKGALRMARQDVYRFVTIRCYLPFVAWMTGRTDQAIEAAREAVELAGQAGHWVSQANALGLAALPLALETGDMAALRHYSAQMQANMDREAIPRWIPVHRYFAALLRHLQGDEEAWRDVGAAIDDMIECRYLLRIPMYIGGFARTLVRCGRLDEARGRIASALRFQEEQGELWCRAELQRIEASIMLRAGDAIHAERRLREALAGAQAIGAVSFELRIAGDLAEHLIVTGRRAEAAELLGSIYAKFSEGFGTQDMLVASRLLQRASDIG
jgi:predicted ATPase/DNA-binding winged helix-turn-helix (wHTH) protein